MARPEALVPSGQRQLRAGIAFHRSSVHHVDLELDTVLLADGTSLPFDALVIATGARLMPEEPEGLLGPGWLETVFSSGQGLPDRTALRVRRRRSSDH
jgi:sulfide:quinone oxidoreductase